MTMHGRVRLNLPAASIQPVRNNWATRSIMPEPQMPRGRTFPTVAQRARPVKASTHTFSIAPVEARMPHSIPPPSKAGPAEQAQAIRKLLLPSTISPLVPMSMNRLMSSVGAARGVQKMPRRDVAAHVAAHTGGKMNPRLRVDVDADLRVAQV